MKSAESARRLPPWVRAGMLVAAAILPAGVRAAEPAAAPATEAVYLQDNVRDLYPIQAEICLSTYEQMSDAPGVLLRLQTDIESFSHYIYTVRRDSLPRGAAQEDRDGAIPVRFDGHDLRPHRIETVIQAVSTSGRKTRPYSIVIGYYPRESDASPGHPNRNWLIVHTSDLALCGGSVGNWIVETPSAEERGYARKRWGRVVSPMHSDVDKARAIAHDLIRTLRPHEGVPSPGMQYTSGFEQLARAESGQDHVWCGNYADIFSAACNALDIPVRKIDMQYVWSSRGRTDFEIAEGHRTTEVFDRTLDRWVWMDLTLGYLGAWTDDHQLLNMAELVQVVNDESRRGRLRVVEFDAATGAERVVPVAESARGKELVRFFRRDQRYKYVRRERLAGSSDTP
ncbi:MAG: hypothetical protein ACHQ52_05950 [Candidatus Eisenbacteria bacterium]